MKNQSNRSAVTGATLLVLLFSISCRAREAASPQHSMFSPASGSPIAIVCGPSDVVVGDLNRDGKPDLVATCEHTRQLVVLLATGGGAFRPFHQITVPDPPGNTVLGDVNGDNYLDLAIDTHDSYGVTLLLGDGKGGLALAPNSPIVMREGPQPHTHGLAMADVNGDRKLDLVTANNAHNDVSIAFGDGRGGFTRVPTTFAVGPSPYQFGFGDVNNDRYPDIIATASATGPQRAQQLRASFALTLLLNDGRGGFRRSDLPIRTGQPWSADVGDVNGDGKADLVATHHDQSKLTVLIGDGTGRFVEGAGSPFDLGRNGSEVILGDANGDGRIDALAAAGDSVRLMLGDGRGSFRPGAPIPAGRGVWRFAVSDLNGDGKMDLVTANLESSSVSVLLGR